MADSIDVKVTGIEAIATSIKELLFAAPIDIQRGVLRVANWIERDGKSHCPVQFGRLRSSITYNWSGSGIARATPKEPCTNKENPTKPDDGVGQPTAKPDAFSAVVGTNVEYAPYVEFSEKSQHEVGGPHFIYNAYFKNEAKVADEVKTELAKRLAKMLKK